MIDYILNKLEEELNYNIIEIGKLARKRSFLIQKSKNLRKEIYSRKKYLKKRDVKFPIGKMSQYEINEMMEISYKPVLKTRRKIAQYLIACCESIKK